MKTRSSRVFPRRVGLLLAGCAAAALAATSAFAFQFTSGQLKGSFDTTLSVGGLYRLNDPSAAYYGTTNFFNGIPGQQYSVNADDGNLNFPKGLRSELFKASHDLELSYGDFGALVRGYYFYDNALENSYHGRTPLSDQAKDRTVRGAELLDMYARAKFDAGSMPVDVRFGRQVLSLGESTFIPNGINIVNPADLAKLRVPGAELKEALLPVNMLKVSVGVTKAVTIEPFWLLEFRRNELEPAGTYFSTNDFASRGGSKVMLGFGGLPDSGTLGGIPRDKDREGGNYNQWGVATHVLAPGLNDTDFGFYYARYHSRSPVISARTPTGPIDSGVVQATANNLAQPALVPAMIAAGIPATSIPTLLPQLLGAALTNVPAASLPPTLTPYAAFYPSVQAIAAGAGKIGLLTAAGTGRYFVEYPEGIDMFGASFNTSLGRTGISWQGEVSYKKDVPLQVDDVELLFAALSTLSPTFGGANNQLGDYLGRYNTEVRGYRRHDVKTAQTTLTKVFGPHFGASQITVLGEVGGVWVNLPDKNTLRYDGPGTFTAGSTAEMVNTGNGAIPATPASAFPDNFSWGYQVAARAEYNNVFAGLNMFPSVAFTHDVRGVTPLPLGNFIAGRKSVNLALEFTLQNKWSFELRYVTFFGAGRTNLLFDRDYAAATVKYSF
jgi:hypothetical protein